MLWATMCSINEIKTGGCVETEQTSGSEATTSDLDRSIVKSRSCAMRRDCSLAPGVVQI